MFDPGGFTPDYVDGLCSSLSELGVDVRLISSVPLFGPFRPDPPYRVDYLFFRLAQGRAKEFFRRRRRLRQMLKALSYPVGLWRTWRALKDGPNGILHVQWALVPILDVVLFRSLRSKGWKIVYTAHDVLNELASPARRWQFRRMCHHVAAVIVHTAGLARKTLDYCGDIVRDVREIPEGLPTFPTPATDVRIGGTGPTLLFFGMIKQYKGLDQLLRAWPIVLTEFPSARLIVAGEPLVSFGPFQRLIDGLAIGDSISLNLGYVPRSEAHRFFGASDAVVLPYTDISTSGVVALSYCYSRAVIATAVGALPEIVRDGVTGFLVPPGSERVLAQVICYGFRDRARLAAMGAAARKWFETERTWDAVARRTVALYATAINEPSAKATTLPSRSGSDEPSDTTRRGIA